MSFGEHLAELRRRLFWAAGAILGGSIVGWFLSGTVLDALRLPVTELAAGHHQQANLNFDSLTAAFDLKIEVALVVGVVISSPLWLYELWAFLVPALKRKELKYALGFFLSAVPLFLIGCVAGWTVVPHIVALMTSFVPDESAALYQASAYFDFILKLVIAVGVAFVLPVFIVLLNFVHIVSARGIIRSWRIAVIVIILFTAVATPSADVVSMFVLAVPMMALYLAAAAIAHLHDRRLERLAGALVAAASVNDQWEGEPRVRLDV